MRIKDYISPTVVVMEIIPGTAVLQTSSSSDDYDVLDFNWSDEGFLS